MAKGKKLPLLVVDGYNVLYAVPSYLALVDEPGNSRPERLSHDPFDRAREAMVADVAAYAQSDYDPVIVFDGANNKSDGRPDLRSAGVRIVFSRQGVSADSVIESLVTEARDHGREVMVVTSDSTIRATVAGEGVSFMSSSLIAHEFNVMNAGIEVEREERTYQRMTLADSLDAETRAKLDRMLGRR